MVKRKKQIFLIYDGLIDNLLMITTSSFKVKQFLKQKIKKGECYYGCNTYPIKEQIKLFNIDYDKKTRMEINNNLTGAHITYIYDGEEL